MKFGRGGGEGTVTSRSGRAGRIAINFVCGAGIVYLFLPIFLIVAFSFNNPAGRDNSTWQGFTLSHWTAAFRDKSLTQPLITSLEVALVATIVATILGTFVAIALVRYRYRGSGSINFLLVVPLTTPEIITGASLLALFFAPPLLSGQVTLGFWTIVIAHISFCVSYVALTVKARIRGFNWVLEDASMDLGATPQRTFFRVTLPLIMPGIMAAALLSFALSIDDFIVTYFVSGNDTITFPIAIYNKSKISTPPEIYVLSTTILAVSILILVAGTLFRKKKPALV
jgi:spermidine/putrescine transport system permease protein